MAKARAIVKRRKAVRNIRKITRTMQMIATAKFQKSLKRAVGGKPYTSGVRQLVSELADVVEDISHPLLRTAGDEDRARRVALLVITSNRGLAGAYNGNVLRRTMAFIREQEAAGTAVDLYVSGKKGVSYFTFQRRPIAERLDKFSDIPVYQDVEVLADHFISQFTSGKIDSLQVAYMNFVSAGVQRPDVLNLLPLADLRSSPPAHAHAAAPPVYEFSPDAQALLDELLPLMVKAALNQCFLDATTSENVARMVAMKSATDNADKMVRSLTMRYNRARQSQITTELSEIMGGVEAMKG